MENVISSILDRLQKHDGYFENHEYRMRLIEEKLLSTVQDNKSKAVQDESKQVVYELEVPTEPSSETEVSKQWNVPDQPEPMIAKIENESTETPPENPILEEKSQAEELQDIPEIEEKPKAENTLIEINLLEEIQAEEQPVDSPAVENETSSILLDRMGKKFRSHSNQPFLSTEEYQEASPENIAEEKPKPAIKESFELKNNGKWLLWLGGLILVMGLGFGAWQIQSSLGPGVKCLLAALLGLGITGAGYYVSKTNKIIGQSGMATGAAVLYFVAFAAGFIEALTCVPIVVSLALMGGIGGVFIWLAEKWKQQQVAGIGLCLANIPALLSAGQYSTMALLPVVLVGLGSSILLVRNEWFKLNVFSLLLSYGSIGGLAFYLHTVDQTIDPLVWLGALGTMWASFIAGFARWSRQWVAREDAQISAEKEGSTVQFDPGQLPWSYISKIANSLIFIALSISVFSFSVTTAWTQSVWDQFGIMLIVIGALEASQLLFSRLRRKQLSVFHATTAMLLFAAATLSMTSGLNQAIILAIQALILASAGSMSPSLRFLRPLSTLPATLVLGYYFESLGRLDYIDLIPPVLLLAGTLPVGLFSKNTNNVVRTKLSLVLELISGNWRAFVAIVLLYAVAIHLSFHHDVYQILFPILTAALAVGIRFGKFKNWLSAFTISFAAAMLYNVIDGTFDQLSILNIIAWLICSLAMFSVGRTQEMPRWIQWVATVAASLNVILYAFAYTLILTDDAPSAVVAQDFYSAITMLGVLFGLNGLYHWLKERDGEEGQVLFEKAIQHLNAFVPFIGLTLAIVAGFVLKVDSIVPLLVLTIPTLLLVAASIWRSSTKYSEAAIAFMAASTFAIGMNVEIVGNIPALLMMLGMVYFSHFIRWEKSKYQVAYSTLASIFISFTAFTMSITIVDDLVDPPFFSATAAIIGLALASVRLFKRDNDYLKVPELKNIQLSPSVIMSALFIGSAFVIAGFVESETTLIPATLITIFFSGVWVHQLAKKTHTKELVQYWVYALPVFIMIAMGQYGVDSNLIALINYVGFIAITSAFWYFKEDEHAMHTTPFLLISGFVSCVLGSVLNELTPIMLVALVLSSFCLAFHQWKVKRLQNELAPIMSNATFVVMMANLLIPVFFYPNMEAFIFTIYAAIIGVLALSVGFPLRSRLYRYTGIGLLLFAVLRVFFVHMIGTDITARVVAFIGTGLMLMVGGYLYGLLAKRFLSEQSEPEDTTQ